MKKIIMLIFVISLFISVSYAKTEFILSPYNFERLLADLRTSTITVPIYVYEIHVGTFVCVDSFTATTGNFLQNLWVRGQAVLTELDVGTSIYTDVMIISTSPYHPPSFQGLPMYSLNIFTDDNRFARFCSASGITRIEISNDVEGGDIFIYDSAGLVPTIALKGRTDVPNYIAGKIEIGGYGSLDAGYYFQVDKFAIFKSSCNFATDLVVGNTIYAHTGNFTEIVWPDGSVSTTSAKNLLGNFVLKSGDIMTGNLTVGASVQANVMQTDSLTANTTVQAHTGNFNEVIVSTIYGRSPVNIPSGIRYADGSVSTYAFTGGGGLTSSSTARIPTVYVCAYNSQQDLKNIANYVCSGTNDYATINNAISYCQSLGGGKVLLEAGTYNFNSTTVSGIYISSNITLSGQGDATIIHSAINAGSSNDGTVTIYRGASNVTIENLTIDREDRNTGYYLVIWGDSQNIRIRNCKFINPQASGQIYIVYSTTNVWIDNNYIESNKYYTIYQNINYPCKNIFITHNLMTYPTSYASNNILAIQLNYAINGIIANNNINGLGNGLRIGTNCYGLNIFGNSCDNNYDYGFYILGTSHTIVGNSAFNNATANAYISVATSRNESNSWNANPLFTDGSNAMTGNFDMGGYSIENCPLIATSTTDVAGLKVSTAGLQAQIAVIISTDGVQWTMILQGATTNTALWDAYINNASTDTTQWTWLLQQASSITAQWNNYYIAVSTNLAQWTQINLNTAEITKIELSTKAIIDNYNVLEASTTDLYVKAIANALSCFNIAMSSGTGILTAPSGQYTVDTDTGFFVFFSTDTNVGDQDGFVVGSTFTLTRVRLRIRTAQPDADIVANITEARTGNNVLIGSAKIPTGNTDSAVITSTYTFKQDDVIEFWVVANSSTIKANLLKYTCNAWKKRGQ